MIATVETIVFFARLRAMPPLQPGENVVEGRVIPPRWKSRHKYRARAK